MQMISTIESRYRVPNVRIRTVNYSLCNRAPTLFDDINAWRGNNNSNETIIRWNVLHFILTFLSLK